MARIYTSIFFYFRNQAPRLACGKKNLTIFLVPRRGINHRMQRLRILSAVEQVAEYLKEGIGKEGVWRGEMPGAAALAAEIGVNHKTVEAALARMLRDGFLADLGVRKPRLICQTADRVSTPSPRIAMLLHDSVDRRKDYMVEISQLPQESGQAPFFSRKSLSELAMDTERVAAFANRTPADAWIEASAPREVLE
jgi:DNA-binding transcriptional regulator YhcF (GntR family)